MYKILKAGNLAGPNYEMLVEAPRVAQRCLPGQFVIVKVGEEGERIPLTISSHDKDTVTVVFQKAGAGTIDLDALGEGDCLQDFAGPLGKPTPIKKYEGRVAVLGGGLGCAIALPVAKALHDAGNDVDLIGGFKTKHLIILEDEMKEASTNLYICTDDGTFGFAGFVTNQLEALIKAGNKYDQVFAIGPLPMMKFASLLAAKYDLPIMVSMSPLMIDGTGMCGCCRVTVGGEIKFACVDGPDFDGHKIDFDEAIARNKSYKEFEAREKAQEEHVCRLTGGVRHA